MYYTSNEVYKYISEIYQDPIIQRKRCAISGQDFAVYQSDTDFYQKAGPVFNNEKFTLPIPEICREERMRKRLARRNNLSFHRDICDFTGKSIISIYSGEKPYLVYHQDVRRSDAWDPLNYGRDFDFSKTFREQYNELMLTVPRMGMTNVNTVNSQYANYIKDGKNCYMTAVTYYGAEDLVYSFWVMDWHNGSDLMYCHHIHQSYECTSSININKCAYIHECNDCSYCQYSTNLRWCEYCFMCYDLHNQKYCFKNKQLTKEEYEKTIVEYKKQQTADDMYDELVILLNTKTLRATSNQNCENSVWSWMKDCNNTRFCFVWESNENSRYLIGEHTTDCMDMTGGTCELVYESINTWLPWTNNIIWCTSVVECHHMYYCDNCYNNSSYCFGSIGLRWSSQVLFNKKYTKHEREKLANKIVHHMQDTGERWQFFPSRYSPFGYNETQSADRYPCSQEHAQSLWYTRYNRSSTQQTGDEIIPLDISKYDTQQSDSAIVEQNTKELLWSIISCSKSKKWFRITAQELQLCVKLNIQLPTLHPEERYKKRYARLSPTELHYRKCDHSGQMILSPYGPERKNKVLAEKIFDTITYW